MHKLLKRLVSGDPAPRPLAVDPKRNGGQDDNHVNATQDVEDVEHSGLGQPVVDKVCQAKGQEVAGADGNEG